MICRAREECQTSRDYVARPPEAPRRRSAALHSDTPQEYDRIALRRASGRRDPLRALGAGDVRGNSPKPRSGTRDAIDRCHQGPTNVRRATPGIDLSVVKATHHPTNRIATDRRMDAKQVWRAALGVAASRSPRPTSRRGCATPSSSTSMSSASCCGSEWIRQGLAGVPLPLADQPDAGPHRRLQRPGRVRHRVDAGRRDRRSGGGAGGRGRSAGRNPGPGRADAGGWRKRDDLHQPAIRSNFIVGTSNRFAHAASPSVARATRQRLQPALPLWRRRLGKTHLLHAIGNQASQVTHSASCMSSTRSSPTNSSPRSSRAALDGVPRSDTAASTCCSSTTSSSSPARRGRRRSSSTRSTRCTRPASRSSCPADRPPRAILSMEDRLRSRLEWGLIADIQPPDIETASPSCGPRRRLPPAGGAAGCHGLHRPQGRRNIRELEGAGSTL